MWGWTSRSSVVAGSIGMGSVRRVVWIIATGMGVAGEVKEVESD